MMKSTGIIPAVCAIRLSCCFLVVAISCTCTLGAAAYQLDSKDSSGKSSAQSQDESWVLPTSLLDELEQLKESSYTASWAELTIQIISNLESLNGIGDPNSKVVFDQLQQQLKQLEFITNQVANAQVQSPVARDNLVAILRQTGYSISRRLAIWPVVHEIAATHQMRFAEIDSQRTGNYLLASSARLNTNSVEQGWAQYLKLDEAAETFNALNSKESLKRKAARDVLARAFNPSLSKSQKSYLAEAIDGVTLEVLKASAVRNLDMHEFLTRLEKLENRSSGAARYRVNDYYQSALWSDDPQAKQLAAQLQTHYRNSNFRVSVHEYLLNQMIPKMPDTHQPFRDEISGAQVRGQTRISNSLHISLIPDPNQISMRLETHGKVKSRTIATRSGVVVENEGDSRFRIIQRLNLGQNGIFAYRPDTTSQVRQRITGLRSNVDNIPPLGWVVRKIARNKIKQAEPMTNRYTRNKLEKEAEDRYEREIQGKLAALETLLTERLLHPLVAMDLEPEPVQISTDEKQIVMRYRLGGRDQMAASTARPRELPGSLMSMQIHESAMNNVISRFEFGGKKFDTPELIQYINQMFQTQFVSEEAEKPAKFEFAHFDPFRIDFDEGKVGISLNLKSFQVGKGKTWKKLSIKGTYNAQIENGFTVKLIQSDDGLKLTGRRLNPADQIAIRLICGALFPSEFSVKLMPEHLGSQLSVNTLQASQFVLANGWIGISVDDAARIASRQQQSQHSPQPRQGRRFLDRWRQQ